MPCTQESKRSPPWFKSRQRPPETASFSTTTPVSPGFSYAAAAGAESPVPPHLHPPTPSSNPQIPVTTHQTNPPLQPSVFNTDTTIPPPSTPLPSPPLIPSIPFPSPASDLFTALSNLQLQQAISPLVSPLPTNSRPIHNAYANMNSSRTSLPLTILLWNSNGLTQRKNELEATIHVNHVDIALITETHFTQRSHINIPHYTTYRTDHPDDRAHGGVAILVRNSLPHHPFPLPPSSDSIQSTAISLRTPSFPYTLAAIYCPPNKPISQTQFLTFLQCLGPHFIAGGDYNAKHPQWGCRVSNPRGVTLLNMLSSSPYHVLSPSQPTYWPSDPQRLPDILDIFITSTCLNHQSKILSFPDLSSDHSPVLLELHPFPILTSTKPSLIQGPVCWSQFQDILDQSLSLTVPLKTEADIDQAVDILTASIQTAVRDATIPQRRTSSDRYHLPLEIRQLIAERRRARARWQRTKYPSDKQTLNRLTHQLSSKLSSYRASCLSKYTSSLSPKDGSLWRATKHILSYKSPPSSLLQPDGTWTKTNSQTASAFSVHLSSIFTPHSDIDDPIHTATTLSDLSIPLQLTPPPPAFSPSDVLHSIKSLPNRKAPGHDLITSAILKRLPRKAILFLTYIYNAILRTTYFPILWKASITIMIPKPNKLTHLPSSYRPISLLPVMGKILEKLLLRRILPILASRDVLPDHQFGFRHHHSTVQQCHRVTDIISTSLELKQYCSGAFLDEAQAFDRVWHSGLLWKLKGILPFTYYLILKSYLSDRYFRVRVGNDLSPVCLAEAGVPQGSILSPILYTLYTADIPQHPLTFFASFADDKAILSSHSDPTTASSILQEHLHILEPWFRKWRIKINEQKSKHVTFTLRHGFCPPVLLNNKIIPAADIVRYLGFNLDKRLTWNPHTRLKRTEVNRRYKLLLRLLDTRSKLSLSLRLQIYNTILKPSWAYGIELWGSTKPSNYHRIQSLQSKILRKLSHLPFYVPNIVIHRDLHVPYVRDLAISRYCSFHSKLPDHPNPLAQSLHREHAPPRRRLKREWPRDLLLLDS